jgi:hypothetical protein
VCAPQTIALICTGLVHDARIGTTAELLGHSLQRSQVSHVTRFEDRLEDNRIMATTTADPMIVSDVRRKHEQQAAEIALKQSDMILESFEHAKQEISELKKNLDEKDRMLVLLQKKSLLLESSAVLLKKELHAANLQCSLREDELTRAEIREKTLQNDVSSTERERSRLLLENVDLHRELKMLRDELQEWERSARENDPAPLSTAPPPSMSSALSVDANAHVVPVAEPNSVAIEIQAHVTKCRELIALSQRRTAENHLTKPQVLTGEDESATTLGLILDERHDKIRIDRVLVGGPAFKSKKLKGDDCIILIDGKNVKEKDIKSALLGPAGTQVTLLIEKPITGKTEEVVLERTLKSLFANECKMFDLFTKIESRFNEHKDPVGVKHTEEALKLWEIMSEEVREHDERCAFFPSQHHSLPCIRHQQMQMHA